ncbi:unnamed protein product [Parascedosporium putredinis]|uniref:C2H2-type domain-containing protein n=1 Tax=Parascedosporium putredinis TaxID=1442378 RepID=A0A9P1GYC3_9PEZI|nr:unnamed protein product [Parascedosporium putredinis]CAI7990553.1 unnamed protein product [Parascedosporium putredinis]
MGFPSGQPRADPSSAPAQSRDKPLASPRIAVVLRAPAVSNQWEDADELGSDALVNSDLSSQYRRKLEEARVGNAPPRLLAKAKQSKAAPPPPVMEGAKPKSTRMGRPKGWRPGMSYADIRKFGPEVAAANASLGPKAPARLQQQARRAGRPKGTGTGTGQVTSSGGVPKSARPPAAAFADPSEHLQRAQAPIVHCGGHLSATTCRWGQCARSVSPPRFATRNALLAHVEMRHITPFAWHVGDGPKVSLPGVRPSGGGGGGDDDETLPDFLFDSRGIQVTPSVRDQQIEDFATWKERRRQLKQLLQRINDALPDEESSSGSDNDKVFAEIIVGGRIGHEWRSGPTL